MINRLYRSEWNCFSFGRIVSVDKDSEGPRRKTGQSCRGTCFGFLWLVLGLAAVLETAGCSANATRTNDASTPIISLAITQAPPASLTVGGTAQLSAAVSNDIANAGVDWVAGCGSAPNCGSFSPSHTASGANTTFTAPLAVPAHNTVAVTALSATDHSKSFSANLTIISTVTAVNITQAPPASAPSGALVTVAATVVGDPSNAGVDWKAACVTPSGTFDCTPPGLHSASGALATFIVPGPLQIPGIVGSTVTLTAFATVDHTFSASASFTATDPLSITLTQVPPSTMPINGTATVVATISNDTTNSGINWAVNCSNSPCGSVSPSHTASGVAATFMAPPTVPAPNPTPNPVVTIVATAAATGGPSLLSATTRVTIVAPISIKITQGVPNDTIVQNHTAIVVATLTNDAANAGVDWTVNCGNPGACGTFSPAHTASGVLTTFTAPATVPPAGNVTITAASTTDPSQTASQTVAVTAGVPPDNLLMGQFVMLLTAKNSINGPFVVGGVISGNGVGALSGLLDLADASGNGTAGDHLSSTVASTYSIGSDGRGQMHLQFNNPGNLGGSVFGVNGAINLSIVFITPQHALLSEIDSFGDATGTLDLQNLQGWSALNGVYSLSLSGFDAARANASYLLASAITIPSGSAYSYITDQSDGGAVTSAPLTTVSQGFANGGPDVNGEVILNNAVNLLPTRQFSFDLWVIDPTHLVVIDWRDATVVGGYLTVQPSSPSIANTYAFTDAGATTAAQPMVAGGIFTCGSTGTLDVVPLTGAGTPLTNQPINATCSAPGNGRALITISGAASTGISTFAAYPTSDQGLYLIELDGGGTGTSGPSGAGVALQQTLSTPITNAGFIGKYASNFLASTALGSQNFAAQIISDGVSALSGTADVDSFNAAPPGGTPSSNATLTGSFTASPDGRFPFTLTMTPATGQPAPQVPTIGPACYIVDANTCLLLGLDATAPGTGILRLQNTGL